jgi:hypothetical protein
LDFVRLNFQLPESISAANVIWPKTKLQTRRDRQTQKSFVAWFPRGKQIVIVIGFVVILGDLQLTNSSKDRH